MPPFGNESEEAVPKKLSYLSFGSAAKPPRSCPSPSLFGAEPDESAGRAGVRGCKPSSNTHVTKIRLPFQDEDEDNFERPIKQAKAQGPMPRPSPFGTEPEEPTEPNFGSSSDGDADESEFQGVSKTVFSLGWNALVDFNRATAFKDQKNKPVEKPKRKYDNSKRSSQAAYSRRNPEFTFKKMVQTLSGCKSFSSRELVSVPVVATYVIPIPNSLPFLFGCLFAHRLNWVN